MTSTSLLAVRRVTLCLAMDLRYRCLRHRLGRDADSGITETTSDGLTKIRSLLFCKDLESLSSDVQYFYVSSLTSPRAFAKAGASGLIRRSLDSKV